MKTLLIPALVIAVASAALPAAAQSHGQGSYGPSRGPAHAQNYNQNQNHWQAISQRKVQLDRRIDQGLRNRQLSPREGKSLKSELNTLVRLERQYQRGGLDRAERRELDRRYDRLEAKIRVERADTHRPNRRH